MQLYHTNTIQTTIFKPQIEEIKREKNQTQFTTKHILTQPSGSSPCRRSAVNNSYV